MAGRTPERSLTISRPPTRSWFAARRKSRRALIDAAPRCVRIAPRGHRRGQRRRPAASARGIVVMNAPGANSVSVAELAMGFVLALARTLRRQTPR
jgi:phosphoglycerate dehydrogenase-like enzyme